MRTKGGERFGEGKTKVREICAKFEDCVIRQALFQWCFCEYVAQSFFHSTGLTHRISNVKLERIRHYFRVYRECSGRVGAWFWCHRRNASSACQKLTRTCCCFVGVKGLKLQWVSSVHRPQLAFFAHNLRNLILFHVYLSTSIALWIPTVLLLLAIIIRALWHITNFEGEQGIRSLTVGHSFSRSLFWPILCQ